MAYAYETDLQAAVIDALTACGCWVMPNVVVRHRKRATGLGTGSPDVLAIVPPTGVHVWFELKRDAKSKLRPGQREWRDQARRFGVRHVHEIRSVSEALAVVQAIRGGRT